MKGAVLWFTAAALALAQPAEIQDGLFVRVTSDLSVIVSRPPLRYPKEAMANLLQGTVVLKASVDDAGRVRNAAVLSGPEAFHTAAIEAVKQWRFVSGPAERQVSIEYKIPAKSLDALESTKAVIAASLSKAPRQPRAPLAGRTVKEIQFLGVGQEAQKPIQDAIAIKVGDTLSNDSMDRAQENLRKLDPKIQFKVLSVGDTEAVVILFRETK